RAHGSSTRRAFGCRADELGQADSVSRRRDGGCAGDDSGSADRSHISGWNQAGHRARTDSVIPGEIIPATGKLMLNANRHSVEIDVENGGDRPIQVGSHLHFYEPT